MILKEKFFQCKEEGTIFHVHAIITVSGYVYANISDFLTKLWCSMCAIPSYLAIGKGVVKIEHGVYSVGDI